MRAGSAADHAGAVVKLVFLAFPSADGAGTVLKRRMLAAEQESLLIIIVLGRDRLSCLFNVIGESRKMGGNKIVGTACQKQEQKNAEQPDEGIASL